MIKFTTTCFILAIFLLGSTILVKANFINPPVLESNVILENEEEPMPPIVEVIETNKEEKQTTKQTVKKEKEKENNGYIKTYSAEDDSLYFLGRKDGKKNFRGYKKAGTAALVLSMLTPVFSLVPCIIMSVVKPNGIETMAPNPELMKNESYREGFYDGVQKKKMNKIWTNFFIGTCILTVFILVLYLMLMTIIISSLSIL